MTTDHICAIDLGTCNSTIAVFANNQVQCIPDSVQLQLYLLLLLTVLEISIVDLPRRQTVVRRIVKSIEKSSISEDVKLKTSETTKQVVGRSSCMEIQMFNLRMITVIPS